MITQIRFKTIIGIRLSQAQANNHWLILLNPIALCYLPSLLTSATHPPPINYSSLLGDPHLFVEVHITCDQQMTD